MKQLHLWRNEKFTDPYIKFINKHFDQSKHLFLIIGKGVGENITPSNNVVEISKNMSGLIRVIKEMYRSDKIHLHSLFIPELIVLLFFQPWLLKKSNWIVWGGDLYCYRNERKTVKSKVKEMMRRRVIKNFNEISTLVPKDFELVKKWYNTKAKYRKAQYVNMKKYQLMNRLREEKSNNNNLKDEIIIHLGNSADPSNNHFEAIRLLKSYKDYNIKIICPLSYGDKQYALKVADYGHEIFAEKFIALTEFMDFEKYTRYLSNVDIGIFNNNRQQGLGNIGPLIFLGKKVYMRSNTSMWEEFHDKLSLNIFDINELKDSNIDELISFSIDSQVMNYQNIKHMYNETSIKLIWEDLFIK